MNEGSPGLPWPMRFARPTQEFPSRDQRGFQKPSSPPREPTVVYSFRCLHSMKRAADHIYLLLTSEPHEVNGVSRNADCQVRILLRMVHRVQEGFSVQDIHVHVIARRAEERVKHAAQVGDAVLGNSPGPSGTYHWVHHHVGETLRIAISFNVMIRAHMADRA